MAIGNNTDQAVISSALLKLHELVKEIKGTFDQVVSLVNTNQMPLTLARQVMTSLRGDLVRNVIRQTSHPRIYNRDDYRTVRNTAFALDDMLRRGEVADTTGFFLNISQQDETPIPPLTTPSDTVLALRQAQMEHLVHGHTQVYPRALDSMRNTCAEVAMCTAAFIFNLPSNVDLYAPRTNSDQIDLMEMAYTYNPSLPVLFDGFNMSNLSRLNKDDVYLVRTGVNGGNGHNSIWFNFDGDWYQSGSGSIGLMRLTNEGRLTSRARAYFAADASGSSWGGALGQYAIMVLPLLEAMPTLIMSDINRHRTT